jgi:carbon storage regulator
MRHGVARHGNTRQGFNQPPNTKGFSMLVLSRKVNERIVVNGNIIITVVRIRGDIVRIGVDAPRDVTVHRQEVADEIARGITREGGQR